MASFTKASKVVYADRTDGANLYRGDISAVYSAGGVPNGGYSLSLLLSACMLHMKRDTSGHHDPAHLTANFLAPCVLGACEIEVRVFSQSKRFTRLDAELWQNKVSGDSSTRSMRIRASLAFTSLAPLRPPEIPTKGNTTVLGHTPIPQAPLCPLRIHPSQCTRGSIYPSANYKEKCVWAEDVGVENQVDEDGRSPMLWGSYWQHLDLEDDLTTSAACMPFLVDQFRNGIELMPNTRSSDTWFATYNLTLQFVAKFPLQAIPGVPDSTPTPRTVGCFARTRWINEGQHEVLSEIWSAPCDIGADVVVGDDEWRSKCQLLATSSQMALPIPMHINHRNGKL